MKLINNLSAIGKISVLLSIILLPEISFSFKFSHKLKSHRQSDTLPAPYSILTDSLGNTDTILNKIYPVKKTCVGYHLIADTTWQNPNVFVISYDTLFQYDYIPVDEAYNYSGRITLNKPFSFFRPSEVLNKPRVALVTGMQGGLYAIANIWWSSAWYSKYDRSKFHLFNDWGEWNQMDKVAHAYSCYLESKWTYDLYKWAGVKEKHAIWIGMLAGMAWQSSIEFNDGFQEKWGFSWGDMAMNASGALLFGIQQYLWHDQKIQLKISASPVRYASYDDPAIRERTDKLYGTSFTEILLKDYNAMTFWLSTSPGAFIRNPNSKFPKWLQFSVGYGTKGMLGGYKNIWSKNDLSGDVAINNSNPDDIIDRTNIQRLHRFYFSADIDWTKIPVKKHWAKGLMKILNIIKLPAPALEINDNHNGSKVSWHWIKF